MKKVVYELDGRSQLPFETTAHSFFVLKTIRRTVFSPGKNNKGEAKASPLLFLPATGAFSNQFLEGMKQLYELEPFIKVKPYLTNQWEKGGRLIKNAS
jgi:hypothetical protein